MSRKIKIFLLSCVLVLACCVQMAAGASENAEAKLVAHNLTITDAGINVNFYVQMQGDVDVVLNDNKVDKADYGNTQEIVVDAKVYDCYKFTQPVVAKEMNKDVSLIIKSGDKNLIDESYSVNKYVAEVQKGGYNYNFESLANAMTYYGEFADVYLKFKNEQIDETPDDKAIAHITNVEASAFEKYAMVVDKTYMPEGLTYKGAQLNLNSEITLRLVFGVEDGVDTEKLVAEEVSYTLKKSGNNCYIDIEKIGADDLDEAYTIKYGGNTIISNCSVLSYAKAVVEKLTTNTKLVNLSKALYLYNQTADTYVTSQATVVYDIFYNGQGFYADPEFTKTVYLTDNNNDVTTTVTSKPVTKLEDLNDSRTKGCSIWMKEAYTVATDENVTTGPYVIRRYTDNQGSVLNVVGTVTLKTTVNGDSGNFAAQHPGGITKFEVKNVANGEISVSGTLNVTGSAKTGVITVTEGNSINADGLTAEGEIVFASYKDVNLSGNGELSSIRLLEDGNGMGHFGVVKHNDNVRIASVICVCGDDVTGEETHSCPWTGNVDGIADVYEIEWQPWNGSISQEKEGSRRLPRTKGSYYLTTSFTINNAATVGNSSASAGEVSVDLDLAGHTVSSGQTYVYAFNYDGKLNIADSSSEKTGKILCTNYIENDTTYNGRMIFVIAGRTTANINLYGGTLGEADNSGNTSNLINLQNGTFNMHGGTIKHDITNTKNVGNAIKVGVSAAAANLNVYGGNIAGDVAITSAGAKVSINDDAKVGVYNESGKSFGIYSTVETASNIKCKNVVAVDGGENIVLKDKTSVALSGTGEASAFKLLEDGAGHFGVVNYNDGTAENAVKFASVICVCGKNVNEHTDPCAWTQANGGLTAVYDIPWEPWDESYSQQKWGLQILPSVSGSYYLVNDMAYTAHNTTVGADVQVNIDLAGHTVTQANTGKRVFLMKGGTLNITDSSGANTGKIICNGTSSVNGRVIQTNEGDTSTVNLFNGTLSSTGGSAAGEVIYHSVGTVNMYGGKVSQTSNVDAIVIANSSIMNVERGEIAGEIQLGSADAVLNIVGSVKVGVSDGSDKEYGIYAPTTLATAPSVVCTNVVAVDGGKNIVLKDERFVALSGTGDASAFEISENPHNKVAVKDNKLDFEARMCNCGALEDGTHKFKADGSQACGVPQEAWQPWNASVSIEADKAVGGTGRVRAPLTSGSYYLTENIEAAVTNTLSNGTTVSLDLAGKTITTTKGRIYTLGQNASVILNIADSKDGGALRFPTGSTATAYDLIWMRADNSVLNLFGGSLTAEGTTSTYASSRLVQRTLGQFYWYGGRLIQNGTITAYSQTTANNSKGFNNPYGLTIETVE